MRTMKTFAAAAAFAMSAAGAAHAAPAPDAHAVLMQKLANVTLKTEKSLTSLVLASADTRLRSKIDNLTIEKPYRQTIPAFTVASAFTY